ncbi:MAG: polymer-forming cytoskeletal protein [Deltaproteobacteria bacterium]|nr:polymer-forming cytoskeletal protein [Deltaproteobacteria bacterium]
MAFGRKDEEARKPVANTGTNAFLGKGSEFQGKLTFEGSVHIDGKFSGEIFSQDELVVGEGAAVSAEIEVGTAVIHGQVTGNIRAKVGVEIHAKGCLKGNIVSPAVVIERGAIFEGNCQMENIGERARAGATTPPPPAFPDLGGLAHS